MQLEHITVDRRTGQVTTETVEVEEIEDPLMDTIEALKIVAGKTAVEAELEKIQSARKERNKKVKAQ